MPYLSRTDIEYMASQIISRYKQAFVPAHHMCYSINPTALAGLFGFSIEYVRITHDASILGQTSSGKIWTTVLDDAGSEMLFLLDGKTILIEKRLLADHRCVGRKNFTIAHELAHQFINRAFPEVYGTQTRTFCDHRRSAKPHKQVTDWYEWQADALAAALLLPPDAVADAMFMFGLGKNMKVLSKKYSRNKYDQFCEMADYLKVSKTALAYRMEHLGLLERNLLVEEAQKAKGVA